MKCPQCSGMGYVPVMLNADFAINWSCTICDNTGRVSFGTWLRLSPYTEWVVRVILGKIN